MDPNANLKEQEDILTQVGPQDSYSTARLRELRSALRGWLSKGGFDPDWAAAPNATVYWRLLRIAPSGWKRS